MSSAFAITPQSKLETRTYQMAKYGTAPHQSQYPEGDASIETEGT